MAKPEKKTPGSPRARRTKAEVQHAFEELVDVAAGTEPPDPKVEAAMAAREDAIRAEVAEVGVENVVQRISGLGLDVSRALGELAEKLTAEVRLLASVKEAVAIERRELERLHKIDIAATALDQLIADHARKSEEFDAAIAERKAQWESEASRAERERREQDEALKRQRQREVEDYEYKKALERKKAQDKYEEEQRQAERRTVERQEALEKDWARREAELKVREEEVKRLSDEVAAFPARIAVETEAAAAEARRSVEASFERQLLVLKKDSEAEARVASLSVKALEQQLQASAAQIAALERQLAEAKQQVQDIAVRAIEGASGARALSHINQIAMEQAKNRPQG